MEEISASFLAAKTFVRRLNKLDRGTSLRHSCDSSARKIIDGCSRNFMLVVILLIDNINVLH